MTGLLADHPGLVTAAVAAWAGFKVMPGVTEKMSGSLQALNDRVGGVRDQFNTVVPYADKMRQAMADNGVEVSKLDSRMMALADTGSGTAQKMAQAYMEASAPLKEFSAGHRDLAETARRAALDAGDGWTATDRIMAVSYTHLTLPTTPYD